MRARGRADLADQGRQAERDLRGPHLPDGNALLEVPSVAVSAWVERTLRIVPPGTEGERLGIDEGLAELLAPLPADDLWLSDPWSADEPSSQDGEA